MSESKSRAASKRAASTKDQAEETQTGETTDTDNTEQGEQSQTGRPEDSGPGTGREAPPEETARYPSTVVNSDSTPLDPPADSHTQAEPEQGHAASTTDNVYAEAGGRTIAGEDYSRLVDAEGNEVSADSLFDDGDKSKTFVTVKMRVYEEFYYPNTNEPAKRLLFAEGRRVPRAQAERIKAALGSAPEPAAVSSGRASSADSGK